MSLVIATNTSSLNTQRWLNISNSSQAKSVERLSSGYKVNKSADDAAGIAIALKLSIKATAVSKSIEAGNQAVAMLQTAESGVEQIANILTRLKELAVEAASDNNASDIGSLNDERAELEAEIDNIAGNTKYGTTVLLGGKNSYTLAGATMTVDNGISSVDVANAKAGTFTLTVAGTDLTLTDGTTSQTVSIGVAPTGLATKEANFSALGVKITVNASLADTTTGTVTVTSGASQFSFQLGAENQANNQITISIGSFLAADLGITGDFADATAAQAYMDVIDGAVTTLNGERAAIGAAQNKIGYHTANMEAMYENTKAAVSTIKDADYAAEMSNFSKYQVMTQAGIAMLSQVNQLPQQILSLLRG